ncbi:hypothetical protein BU16DRAFT_525861 [Lophium mytilinum]|uniref:Uncharacterized protein n=1 Tax=Lophium mytilinum TaxID=390894 RepID=A0A6A6QWB0_9PEZI|nr:hypothetical protein BU16DRAFT_525861 [Lophium mytilinum]
MAPNDNPNETSPMLESGERDTRKSVKTSLSRTASIIHFFLGGIVSPDAVAYEPIEILLNTEDEKERDELTRQWRNHKLEELNFVGIVSALLAGVLTSTGSWPNILPNGGPNPVSVRATFYAGIILALFSLLTSASQTIRLHRMSAHRDAPLRIRRLLRGPHGHPRKAQIYAWQLPVAFLTAAVVCMVVGMFMLVWSATAGWREAGEEGWWNENSKMAVAFTVVAVASIGAFLAGHYSLYEDGED